MTQVYRSAFLNDPFPHQFAFDNTSLSAFKNCPRYYYYSIYQGWRKKGPSPALAFGGLYHEGVEHYDTFRAHGVPHEQALLNTIILVSASCEAAPLPEGDNRRTYLTLMRSLVWYAEEHKNDNLKVAVLPDGKLGLELSFSFELPFGSPSTEPYIYCGHIDKLIEWQGGTYVVERKHTTSTISDYFYQRYATSDQITGYHFAGKVVFRTPIVGSMIEATQVAVNFTRFDRRMIARADAFMDEWLNLTEYWIGQVTMEFEKLHNAAPSFLPNHESCNKFGGCVFLEVCSKSPHMRDIILEADFEKKHWQPLKNRGDADE